MPLEQHLLIIIFLGVDCYYFLHLSWLQWVWNVSVIKKPFWERFSVSLIWFTILLTFLLCKNYYLEFHLLSQLYNLDIETISSLAAEVACLSRNLRNDLNAMNKRLLQQRATRTTSGSSVSSRASVGDAAGDTATELPAANEILHKAIGLLSATRNLLYWVLRLAILQLVQCP